MRRDAIARALAPGESLHVCTHPRALPEAAPSAPPIADFVALPFAFAWLYPDSMLVVDALAVARRGLILHGSLDATGHEPLGVVTRLVSICRELRLEVSLRRVGGDEVGVQTASDLLLRGELVLRAVRVD
jgi:hypothetical protein